MLIEFQNVSFSSNDHLILKDITFGIEHADFISVVGPSGSGKSTILKLLCNLISPTQGQILYRGKNMNEYNPIELRKSIGYCFQTPYLFGKSVEDNLIFPYAIRNLKLDQQRINSLFSTFDIPPDYLDKDIKTLSGGEKQRIGLIRTLLFPPEILLLDEVTSALDTGNTQIVENAVVRLNQEGTTVLWITHNPGQSRKYANKLLSIEAGEVQKLEVLK